MNKVKFFISIFFTVIFNVTLSQVIDISSLDWKIWLDNKAEWQNDSLYLPPVDISTLPVNEPTCGWSVLFDGRGFKTTLPATTEEHFWDRNRNTYGIAGNHEGVSWFSTDIEIPAYAKNKRIVLKFESVDVRAEVFLNQQLVGYDIIGGTPFTIDISKYAKAGQSNKLAVRVTEHEGHFTWRDYNLQKWGKNNTPGRKGFGGITGTVKLEISDKVFIDNVFIKNKPEPEKIDAQVTMGNLTDKEYNGMLTIRIIEKATGKSIYTTTENVSIHSDETVKKISISVPEAKLWSVESPNLYTIKLNLRTNDGLISEKVETFGFRWFDMKEIGGDKMFFLNGKRIVLRTAISWGFWPVSGAYPTPELAKKQVVTAKSLGLNMINFHRSMGHPISLDAADESGFLYYEEPGGYGQSENPFVWEWNKLKMERMILRDRNHPSLVIYDLINEAGRGPKDHEREDMKHFHQLDETRFLTFSSQAYGKNINDGNPVLVPHPMKSFMSPYEHDIKIFGWWDKHKAGGEGVYHDEIYNSPTDFFKYFDHPSEIIFWGEEGAVGTPARLDLVQKEIRKNDLKGWDSDDFLSQYTAYKIFLEEKEFTKAFPTVDDLTVSIGNVSHYHQARRIENIRCGNTTDAYAINGWEENKIENHSGIVDIYRNSKGDPSILAYYNQPLYIAVKLRNKVLPAGESTKADFYIINEKNIKGKHTLKITVEDEKGIQSTTIYKVEVKGGTEYGQLLLEAIDINVRSKGYTAVKAQLFNGEKEVATGKDLIFAVELDTSQLPELAIVDSSGSIQSMLNNIGKINIKNYGPSLQPYERVLIASDLPNGWSNRMDNIQQPLLEWVTKGNTMIIVDHAKEWAKFLKLKEVIDYRGSEDAWIHWYGGNFFVKDHPLFEDLPTNIAFNWEYQCLARYNRERFGLRLYGEECIAGIQIEHHHELLSAVSIIPFGDGKIILSTLDLKGAILDNSSASVVAKKILLNYIAYSCR